MNNYWFLFFSGIIFLVIGIFVLRKELGLRKNGVRVTGVIVEVIREEDMDGTSFRPVVQFTTHEGQSIVWRSTETGSIWRNALDKPMRIIYDPQNPQEVLRSHWSSSIMPVLFIVVGAAACIAPFFLH